MDAYNGVRRRAGEYPNFGSGSSHCFSAGLRVPYRLTVEL